MISLYHRGLWTRSLYHPCRYDGLRAVRDDGYLWVTFWLVVQGFGHDEDDAQNAFITHRLLFHNFYRDFLRV